MAYPVPAHQMLQFGNPNQLQMGFTPFGTQPQQPQMGATAFNNTQLGFQPLGFQNPPQNQPVPTTTTTGVTTSAPSTSGNINQFITGTNNVDGTETLSTSSALASASSTNALDPNAGLFGDMTGQDWLNFGGNALATVGGLYFANEQLGLQQDALQLSQDKFNNYLQEQQALDDAYESRS